MKILCSPWAGLVIDPLLKKGAGVLAFNMLVMFSFLAK
jgi:hypothetical protein